MPAMNSGGLAVIIGRRAQIVVDGRAGLCALVDVGAAQPLRERHRVDTEVFDDLLDRHLT